MIPRYLASGTEDKTWPQSEYKWC